MLPDVKSNFKVSSVDSVLTFTSVKVKADCESFGDINFMLIMFILRLVIRLLCLGFWIMDLLILLWIKELMVMVSMLILIGN